MSRSAISHAHAHLRKLVTLEATPRGEEGNGVHSDQQPDLEFWGQHASVKRIESQDPSVGVSLFPLLTSFLGHRTLPAMMGNIHIANSPDALEDIDISDNSSFALAAKLPRWFPPLRKSHDAREYLHQGLPHFALR